MKEKIKVGGILYTRIYIKLELLLLLVASKSIETCH